MTAVLAYQRCSTDEQARSGLGLDAQRTAIQKAAAQRDWQIQDWIIDNQSGKTLDRPGIQQAIQQLENGGPDVLVVSHHDRLSRSTIDFLTVVDRATSHGWALIVLNLDLDMTTPMGRFAATIMAGVAELERGLISARTKDALAAAKQKGIHVGRPAYGAEPHEQSVVTQIRAMHDQGLSTRAIADKLNQDGVTAKQGGQWQSAQIARILRR